MLARVDLRAFALNLTQPLPVVVPRLAVDIRRALPGDLLASDAAMPSVRRVLEESGRGGDPEAALERALADSHLCFVAEHAGTIVHVRWANLRSASIPRLGVWATLRTGEACGFAAYTVPSVRGHGLHAAVLAAMAEHLQARGTRTLYFWVMSGNTASLRTMARVGAREIVRVIQWVWRLGREVLLFADVLVAPNAPAGHVLSPDRLGLRPPVIAVRWRHRSRWFGPLPALDSVRKDV